MVTDMRVLKTTIQRDFYRNGQLREEVPLRTGRRHGVVRTWHRNGVLASEEPYYDDLPHGICRQWDENGKLLGQYRMEHGTGVQRAWHDNGRLQIEVSTVNGEFCGRNRIWLRDGTLLSEEFCDHGRTVTAAKYRRAAAKDPSLPRVRGRSGEPLPRTTMGEQSIHRVFVRWLLSKPHHCEARKWLEKPGRNGTRRSLGRFKSETAAAEFVEELYQAGAVVVIVPDIYNNKTGDQFSDGLLVKLPKDRKSRKTVRAVCTGLVKRKLGAFEPDRDIGESHLFVSMT